MLWVEVMRRVGGFDDLLALEDDGRRYEDVLLTIRGEHEAQVIRGLRAQIAAEVAESGDDDGDG